MMDDIEDLDRLIITSLIDNAKTSQDVQTIIRNTIKNHKLKNYPRNSDILQKYRRLNNQDPKNFPTRSALEDLLIKKSGRSRSGIINVSVVMKPDKFSCRYNCRFCPDERIIHGASQDMPRSYLSNEDAVRRASQVSFDPIDQINVRLNALIENGHIIDKIELRILGGTFSCYPHAYAKEFIRDLYYAVNIYGKNRRIPLSLEEEQIVNETNNIHIVGLGLETRPDEITIPEMMRFRSYGCTRVEIGIQHTNDHLLRRVNRGHGIKHSIKAVRLLKNAGFKVEIHIMIDLPGATPEIDKECYHRILQGQDLLPDYLKDYPCLDVEYTEIKKWKKQGLWKPYAEYDFTAFKDVLIYRQSITPIFVRVNRTQRDFPNAKESNGFIGYKSETIPSNLGQVIHLEAEKQGIYCQCIRCREIGIQTFDRKDMVFMVKRFEASEAPEYFISAEIPRDRRNILLGFLRLRINNSTIINIPEIVGYSAMIRELHVYGRVCRVGDDQNRVQHQGIGKELIRRAERIALMHMVPRIYVISAVGTREYYRKQGYRLKETYMVKSFHFWYYIIICYRVLLDWILDMLKF